MKTNKFNKLKGNKFKIAIVQARFNQEITDNLVKGSLKALKDAGILEKNIKIFQVPGSFEIPLFCQRIARKKKFDGIITIGAVIKGATAHFEYISKATVDGILITSLDYSLPISLGVITTYNLKQAKDRSGNNKENKGVEAALALIETLTSLEKIN